MPLYPKTAQLTSVALLSGVLLIAACSRSGDSARQADTAKDTTTTAAAAVSPTDLVGTNGQYATVNGLKMYYEIHGTAHGTTRPLVLLHGAFSQTRTDFPELLPLWAKTRQVIAIEQQGHGHTGDIDRPLTYAQMADDTAELLKQLKIESADIFGYSMGGGIALQMAISHPELVHKIVDMGGAMYRAEGFYPELLPMEATMTPDMMKDTPWKAAYDSVAPNKADFPKLVERIKVLDTKFLGWSPKEIQGIKAPVMLIVGDADVVRPEHVVQFFRLLGGGVAGDLQPLPAAQLAILPGTNHQLIVHRTDWLFSMTNAFLDAPPPAAQDAAAPKRD
jgi:pimeloyl-ACP methyl ester carboxylesterase